MITAGSYENIIRERAPDEKTEDVVEMIEVLASERISYHTLPNGPRSDQARTQHYDFAAKVLCMIFDIFKDESYQSKMRTFRKNFSGIARDTQLRKAFSRSLMSPLIQEIDERKIFERAKQYGFESLFKDEFKALGLA